MATLLFFHAHPDDEAISTGATMASAASEGHRVILVLATRGELGEAPTGIGGPDELAALRERETQAAAKILGASRVGFLGYRDSGMPGDAANSHPEAFAAADVEDAAGRLVSILRDEQVDVLVIYEPNGGSGHPDHVQVHRVGARAAQLVDVATYESAMNRDHFLRLMDAARDLDLELPSPPSDLQDFGVAEDAITLTVDGRDHAPAKRAAMAAHASQIAETSVFLAVPEPFFAGTWGYEWYLHHNDRARCEDPLRLITAKGPCAV